MTTDPKTARRLGRHDVLIPAKGLQCLPGVRRKAGCRRVTYHHLVFDAHEIVFTEDAPSESFYPGPLALQTVPTAVRRELAEICPDLDWTVPRSTVPMAHEEIGAGRAERLLARAN